MKDLETLRLGDGEPWWQAAKIYEPSMPHEFPASLEAGKTANLRVDEVAFKLEAEPEVVEAPACVVAKLPKTRQVVRRAMSEEEAVMVKVIRCCVTFSVGHWDKRFMREMPEEITDKQAVQVWRIFKTYRRQIDTARCGITAEKKEELLRKAAVVVEAFQAGERDTSRDGITAEKKGEG